MQNIKNPETDGFGFLINWDQKTKETK